MEKENLDNGIKPDVNESLALAGLFRKVSADERMPNKTGLYHTNRGMTNYFHGLQKFEHDPHIDYWLEEIELPTQKQITNERTERNYQTFQFDLGAIWMRNFVLAGKAVTAKDNVR